MSYIIDAGGASDLRAVGALAAFLAEADALTPYRLDATCDGLARLFARLSMLMAQTPPPVEIAPLIDAALTAGGDVTLWYYWSADWIAEKPPARPDLIALEQRAAWTAHHNIGRWRVAPVNETPEPVPAELRAAAARLRDAIDALIAA